MCAPMIGGLLSAGVGAMGSIAKYGAEVEDFNRQEAMWKENYVNSLAAGRDEANQLTAKGVQEQEANSQKVSEYTIEEVIKKSQAEVSAASSGVGGNSVQDIILDIGRGAGRNRYYANENYKATAMQLQAERKAADARTINRINSVQRPQKPSAAGAFLGIAGGFASALGSMN